MRRRRLANLRLRVAVFIGLMTLAAGCGMLRVNIVGNAMAPTLSDGDAAIATRSFEDVALGDIVAFRSPRDASRSFVMRIIGLPGDRVDMREGRLWINGGVVEESYVTEANRSRDTWGPITVPADAYFMLGDNRRDSSDSRVWGPVGREAIWAKVVGR